MNLARRLTITADTLREREKQILVILQSSPGKQRGEYAKEIGVAPNSMGAYLDALAAIGLCHSRGYGRGATWWPGEAPPKVIEVARVKLGPNSVWGLA